MAPLSTLAGPSTRQDVALTFATVMEEPLVERPESKLCGRSAYFRIRVICHERPNYRDRYAGCKEYCWQVQRRITDFQELDSSLRSLGVLPASVMVPKFGLFWKMSLCSAEEFVTQVQQRSQELHIFVVQALEAAAAYVTSQPEKYRDILDLGTDITKFLGVEEASEECRWAPPKAAEEYQVALVHSMDNRGIYVWGHPDSGASQSRLTRFGRQANLGDLTATYAEARRCSSIGKDSSLASQRRSGSDVSVFESPNRRPSCKATSPQLTASSSPSFSFGTPSSLFSSPSVSRLPSPAASPAQSRCPSPPRLERYRGDDVLSITSVSTDDTTPTLTLTYSTLSSWPPKVVSAVWTEVDLDVEWQKKEEHTQWWASVLGQMKAQEASGPKNSKDQTHGRRSAIVDFEKAASLFRELSSRHQELHPILGYGTENKTLVIVQQASSCCGLRSLPFTQQRCHRVLGQLLKALDRLHEQHIPHGQLSPECILIEEGPLGPQVRLCWIPGQKRAAERRSLATLGFRGPGEYFDMSSDIWAMACVILVWWAGFTPVSHPWTQFSKAQKLQQEIHNALAEEPPQMPKALLDLHLASALAEEPEHTFLSLLASLLTRCLSWDPSERPTAKQLLHHPFFEQAL